MDDLTNQGIQALRGGEKVRARSLFLSALEIDADNAQAWLWLSGAVESEQDRLDCLEQVLRIDPNNQAAAKGVALLVGKGLVPVELRGLPGEEANLQPQANNQDGWQHEVPEETLAVPTTSIPETVPKGVNIAAASEIPEKEEIPAALTETPDAMETTPAPAVGSGEAGEENFKLPESFFQPPEAAEDTIPGWMATLTPEDAALPPAALTGQAESGLVEAEASTMAPPIPPAGVQAPGETIPQVMENHAAAAAVRPEEKTLFKVRPSLVTTVIVYGLGAIILFAATIGLLLTITNAESMPVLIGLVLVVFLLIAMLGLLILKTLSHLMTSYIFTNRRLYLEKGVVRRSHKSILIDKITRVTLRQGPLQKIIGIGNLTVHTETQDGKEELTRLIDVSKAAQVINRIDVAQHEAS